MNNRNIVMGPKSREKVELARAMRRVMTKSEALLWHHLRGSKVNGLNFRRQQVIDGFIADFYCHAAGLVVEADCRSHDGRTEYDEYRDTIIAARGLRVLRFTNESILNDIAGVIAVVAEATHPQPPPEAGGGD